LSTWKIVEGTCSVSWIKICRKCAATCEDIPSLSLSTWSFWVLVTSSMLHWWVSTNRQTTYLQAWKTICSFSPKIGACGDGSGLQTVVLDVLTLNFHQFWWHHSSKMHWTDINRRLELSIKSPCLWASFDLHPLFY
jgi:hypothetical protein